MSRGFKAQIQDIFTFIPVEIQIAIFSTTMPIEILELTKEYLKTPVKIMIKSEDLTLESIKQFYLSIEKEEWKNEILLDIISNLDFT